MNLYLIEGQKKHALAAAMSLCDIDRSKLSGLGEPIRIHLIGISHPDTPPGILLVGQDLTRLRPLGLEV